MKKLGLLLCILAGITMLISLVLGIPTLVGSDFRAAQVLPFSYRRIPLETVIEPVQISKQLDTAIWLRVPNRGIETEEIVVSLDFIAADGHSRVSLTKNFGFWHTRSGGSQGQHYRLGSLNFSDGFHGSIRIGIQGDWHPGAEAALVLNPEPKGKKAQLYRYLGLFAAGVLGLVLGIWLLARKRE